MVSKKNFRTHIQIVFFILGLLLFSCTHQQDQLPSTIVSPKVIIADGYLVPSSSISPPEIKPAGIPLITKAGKPKIVKANSIIFPAGEPKVVTAGIPKICTPGTDTFSLPKIFPATDSSVLAGIPEIVIAKEAHINDDNPQNFSLYGKLQGLKEGHIFCMLEDKKKNIWFGTSGGGVSKYDGKSFTNYTAKEGFGNSVYCMLEDKNGNIWFSVETGICRYDGKFCTYFKNNESVSNYGVCSMIEDKIGNIWFGTNGGGVYKYDGNRVEAIERGDKSARQNQQDLKKTNGKLVKSFTHFTTKQGLSSNIIFKVLEDKNGNIWFGTQGGGASRYNGHSFSQFGYNEGFSNNHIRNLFEDKIGNIWFGIDGEGICKYDGNRVEAIEKGDKDAQQWQKDLNKTNGKLIKTFTYYMDKQGLFGNAVLAMYEDKTGNIWTGSYAGGLCKFDGNRIDAIENGDKTAQLKQEDLKKVNGKLIKCFTHFDEKQGLSYKDVRCMLEDKSGNLWFGTDGRGVCRYDGKSFTHFTEKEGIPNKIVWSMFKDNSGTVWFGTYLGGAFKYDGESFTYYTQTEGLTNNYIKSILQDKYGNIWFSFMNNGAAKYDGKTFSHFAMQQGLFRNQVSCMLADKIGNIWFGSAEGVCRYNGSRIDAIEGSDKTAQLTQQGLNKSNEKLLKTFTYFTSKSGLSGNSVSSMLEDRIGNIWIGTSDGGVTKYTYPNMEKNAAFTHFTEKEGLCNNNVISIFEDKIGNIWFGTFGGGVSKYDGNRVEAIEKGKIIPLNELQDLKRVNGKLVKSFTNYTTKEGLSNNVITSILEDKNGNIWLGTSIGLSKLIQTKLGEVSGKAKSRTVLENNVIIKNYGYEDGFLGIGCRLKSICEDNNGTIWIGSDDRLTAYHPEGDNPDTIAPNIQITNVELFNENINWINLEHKKDTNIILGNGVRVGNFKFDGISKWYSLPENLSLAYNNNYLTFKFIGITQKQSRKVKYQYKLEGIDQNWSAVTVSTEAPYGNLPQGKYTFKVKAVNSEGYWSSEYNYTFSIRPPWWKTWWMYTIYGISIILLVAGIVWWNGRRLRERAKELVGEVRKATKEIVEQKHLIEEKHKEITDSINYAERIQRALLASKKLLNENLADYFILFKPKDIVSGDFYWAAKLNNDNFAVVTADSTGHGVPGAIMSILNIACLKEAVTQNLSSPEIILNETRRLIIENLKNDGSAEGGKDGMDASLLSFDFKNNILYCAAANNPVWIIRGPELIEIKADRMPVGKHDKDKTPFTLHTINLQKGDIVYTLTDGFADQFGGEKGKKFKYKELQELLLSISNEPSSVQKEKLNEAFDNWKGNLEQVDDVCLMGVRV